MQLALIPPYSMATQTALRSKYHLVLPQCLENDQYAEYVRRAAARGDFIMLDNGVAEGVSSDNQQLARIAEEYGVNEIVLPDVMHDWEASCKRTLASADYFAGNTSSKLAVVVQGNDFTEVMRCIEKILDGLDWHISTICIPRNLLKKMGKYARCRIAAEILSWGFNIHFLGADGDFARELWAAQQIFGAHIRGMDTSLPYYAGLANVDLSTAKSLGFGRQPGYFELQPHPHQVDIINKNINLMLGWTDGQ